MAGRDRPNTERRRPAASPQDEETRRAPSTSDLSSSPRPREGEPTRPPPPRPHPAGSRTRTPRPPRPGRLYLSIRSSRSRASLLSHAVPHGNRVTGWGADLGKAQANRTEGSPIRGGGVGGPQGSANFRGGRDGAAAPPDVRGADRDAVGARPPDRELSRLIEIDDIPPSLLLTARPTWRVVPVN